MVKKTLKVGTPKKRTAKSNLTRRVAGNKKEKAEPKKARPLPKGVINDEARYAPDDRERRADGTWRPRSSFASKTRRTKVDVHIQNFDLKQAFLETFRLMGGVEELANWATYSNANQTEFYKMLARLLPREVGFTGGGIEPNKLNALEDKELDAIINRHLTRS